MIVFGPFLTRSEHPDLIEDRFMHTGYSMEMVVDETHHLLPIYRDAYHLKNEHACFDDFYFPEPEQGWPVDFIYQSVHERYGPNGLYVGISPVLREIFRTLKPASNLEDFLREFRALIPVSNTREPGRYYKPECEIRLTDQLTADGYIVSEIASYGTRLTIDIAWTFRDEYRGWQNIAAAYMDFRPRCGNLNDGKWSSPRWRERIEDHFFKRFEAIKPDRPIDCFHSAKDIHNLLSHFEWSPTTLHSEKEIREKRVAFVNASRHLWEAPKELANALHHSKLYSPSTSIHQIVKFLPSLIKDAKFGLRKE